MNVAFLVNDLQLSGGVGVVVEHARQLPRHGIAATLVLAREQEDPDWRFRGLGEVEVLSLADARARRFDVALSTWWETTAALFELDAAHRGAFVQSLEDRFYRRDEPQRLGAALAQDLPVHVVTEARWIAQTLEELRGEQRVLYVRNGIAKDVFTAPDTLAVRRGEPLRIVIEGNPHVWFKGVGEALAAVRAMTQPRHVTLVSGVRDVDTAGADEIVGPLSHEQMAQLYARSDVVLKLSRVEGMFGPPLEGFHCGATCVVTAVTGHEEYVEHGVNGLRRRLGRPARDVAGAGPARRRPRAAAPPALRRAGHGAGVAVVGAVQHGDGRRAARAGPPPAARQHPGAGQRAGHGARRRRAAGAGGRPARPAALPRRAAGAPGRDRRARAAALAAGAAAPPVAQGAPVVIRGAARRVLGRGDAGPLRVTAPPALLEVARDGVVELAPAAGPPPERLRIAVVVPQFRRGSGGHSTIMHLLRGLAARGHSCSVWIEDSDGTHHGQQPAEVEARFRDWFGASATDVHASFEAWNGADVVLATGWQTVHRVLRLPGAVARGYLVQDHEPEFYGTSAERTWAEETYGLGLPCVAASPWLAQLLADRYGARADSFDLGVDHGVYAPVAEIDRRADTVVLYARAVTARRAVPLGLLALRELRRQRPRTRVVLYGEARAIDAGFDAEQPGVLDGPQLAELYAEATVGVVLSMTNPSLVPLEMAACGLPVVDLASESMRATFGDDGPIALAPFDPVALAGAIAALMDDDDERERRGAAGLRLAGERTWPRAAGQLEAAIRGWLA